MIESVHNLVLTTVGVLVPCIIALVSYAVIAATADEVSRE